jgi:hypothetical protein
LKWYVNRLKTISFQEVIFRLNQLFKQKVGEKNIALFPTVDLIINPLNIICVDKLRKKNYNNIINIFNTKIEISKSINWHLDLYSKNEFPKICATNITTRNDKIGIAKFVWEINRMQFLTAIALQYHQTKNQKYLLLFQSINQSWINENPYLIGVNWTSNIEINLRLITWFFCWDIMNVNYLINENNKFKKFVKETWIPMLYLHCKYSYEHPSKFSSANNHLISEATGLFIASSFWKFDESIKWKKYSKKILEREIIKQHTINGINREQAAEYIQFNIDFFLLAYIVAERTNNSFSDYYKAMLRNIFTYIYNLIDISGNIPRYGDGDEGYAFILGYENRHKNFKSLLTSGAIIFNNKEFKSRSDGFDLKNEILFGQKGKEIFDLISDQSANRRSKFYKDDGHFIFRKEKYNQEVYLHFNVAPLGYLSIAAHGHADALSFSLHIDGNPILIDPGTYCYHSDPEWRTYFKGTLAHNTIRVDQKDMAINGGATLWIKHYNTKVSGAQHNSKVEFVRASHNGYSKYGVEHIRNINFLKDNNEFIITDFLNIKKNKNHCFEVAFHIHPDVRIEKVNEQNYKLNYNGSREVQFLFDNTLNPEIKNGQLKPILGWYSPGFYKRVPTNVIYSKFTANQSFKIVNKLKVLS